LRSAVSSRSKAVSAERAPAPSAALVLAGLLLAALVVRLLFIGADGFKNDVVTFEAWSLTLAEHPLREFFAKAGFADYPPGYFFILWVIGHAYKLLVHSDPSYTILKFAVKLPAIVMDLVDAALVFAIVRRFAALPWAFGAAAFFAFNPATIFISAYWGQVDSVAAGFVLAALLMVLRSESQTGGAAILSLVLAWLSIGYSILIKPPASVLVPLLLAFVFAAPDSRARATRALGTALGIFGALTLAYLMALAFHPGLDPLAQFEWLYGRYQYASGVYPDNSVNAFNLYALRQSFWQPDAQLIPNLSIGPFTFGLPQYTWGIALFAVATVLIVSRYLQRRDSQAFLEAALLLSLGFFILATRMHERYIFNAFLFAPMLMFAGRRYLWVAVAISLTLFANLEYSLHYLAVMDAHEQGVDATNLWPWVSRPAAALNVAAFFYLGYVYLGARSDALEEFDISRAAARVVAVPARSWFSPLEGTGFMVAVDYAIAAGLSVLSFVLTYVNFWKPGEKIFDEIYYARAAEEYIGRKEIFEFTHPPLTKLVITLSTLMFGDNAYGWRFLNLVVGAITVFVLYAFAKRILRSTPFATICASFLVFDGFHFVQARIATPEITVAFFALTTLYAFYRFWIASQVRVAPLADRPLVTRQVAAMAGATILAGVLASLVARGQDTAAFVVSFLYFEIGAYLVVRLVMPKLGALARPGGAADVTSYAEGSYVTRGELVAFDGGRVPAAAASRSANAKAQAGIGEVTTPTKSGRTYTEGELRIEYRRDGSTAYETPDGTALFTPDGAMDVGDARVARRNAGIWLWLLALSGGALAASKWNGLFDFMVVFLLVGVVALQVLWTPALRAMGLRVVPRPAKWGNPRGFSVDVVVAAMAFVGATVYVLTYIPYFSMGHNLADLVGMQKGMFGYHYDLHATHPYSSKWWQWPLLQIPISYYYKDFRTGAAMQNSAACCVAEILALPNPAVWWLGLFSVPYVAWLAWRERVKAYLLLIVAYLLQWLPWIASPRVAFEYHFYPNLAIICLADAILLQRVWSLAKQGSPAFAGPRLAVGVYVAVVVLAFMFWHPVLAGTPVSYNDWNARMLGWLMGQLWINPHPGH
jgi:Gpi18-like mannosyltransferase